jgi:probable phosphoglycerate mutase
MMGAGFEAHRDVASVSRSDPERARLSPISKNRRHSAGMLDTSSGEAMSAMQVRMVAALEVVVADHPGDLVVVVSHADPIKAAIAHYTGLHLDLFQRIVVSPASVTVLELSQYGAAMVKCNDTGSLDELVPKAHEADPSEADPSVAGTPEEVTPEDAHQEKPA